MCAYWSERSRCLYPGYVHRGELLSNAAGLQFHHTVIRSEPGSEAPILLLWMFFNENTERQSDFWSLELTVRTVSQPATATLAD